MALCNVIIQTRASRDPLLLVGVGQERQTIHEPAQRRLRLAALVFARGGDELGEVFDPALGVLAPFLAEVLKVAALIEHLADRNRHGLAARHLGEVDDEVAERGEGCGGAVGERAVLETADQAGPQRVGRQRRLKPRRQQGQIVVRAGLDVLDRLHHALADPARRRVDHPAQAHIVVRVDHEPHVGERVLDLAALVEPDAADDLVGDALAHQRVFNRARLRVGPGTAPRPATRRRRPAPFARCA